MILKIAPLSPTLSCKYKIGPGEENFTAIAEKIKKGVRRITAMNEIKKSITRFIACCQNGIISDFNSSKSAPYIFVILTLPDKIT